MENHFDCNKCHKSRPSDLRIIGHKYCKICDGHRANQQTKSPMSLEEFEEAFMERRRLEAAGMKVCPACKRELPRAEMNKNGRCQTCYSAERIKQKRGARARKAEQEGRHFVPRAGFKGLPKGWIRGIPGERTYSESLLARNSYEALRHWLAGKASDEQVEKWFAAGGKPWNNPRLTAAEKWCARYQLDPEFQASERIRRQVNKAIKRDGVSELIRGAIRRNGESRAVFGLLGYTIAALMERLESTFTEGMSWDEFRTGRIHIDHITPQAAFDMQDDSQFAACWSLDNLQALWAQDNLRKGSVMECGARARRAA